MSCEEDIDQVEGLLRDQELKGHRTEAELEKTWSLFFFA